MSFGPRTSRGPARAVATVLWDREYKRSCAGKVETPTTPGGFEHRGFSTKADDIVFGTG
jgi:hypothetical protein